jgi:mutator protein MutT
MTEEKKVLRVVGCIIEHEDQILMLLRSEVETDPSLWGIPAGKVEAGESDLEAIIREVQEETGIELKQGTIEYLGELSIEYPKITVVFPVFKVRLAQQPEIVLAPREHIDFGWIHPQEVLKLPNLMKDVDVIIEKFSNL